MPLQGENPYKFVMVKAGDGKNFGDMSAALLRLRAGTTCSNGG